MDSIAENLWDVIGNTPMVYLNRVTAGCVAKVGKLRQNNDNIATAVEISFTVFCGKLQSVTDCEKCVFLCENLFILWEA